MKATNKQKLIEAARYAHADLTSTDFWDEFEKLQEDRETKSRKLVAPRPIKKETI